LRIATVDLTVLCATQYFATSEFRATELHLMLGGAR
jgi:hypothetical protein